MKKVLGILLVVTLFVTSGFAQDFKFGHINSGDLLAVMPERDSARAELQNYSKMLQNDIETMQKEYQNKVSIYLEKKDTYSDLVRQSKEGEIQEMQQRIQVFQQTAQQDLQQKEAELFQPIMDKAQAAIEKVGKDNGFTYIFDLGAGSVVFFSQKSIDVLPLVKKELGLQ